MSHVTPAIVFSILSSFFNIYSWQVKVGVKGAEECGNFEEWFNYRLSRAAPDTCAKFLGSFVADKTSSEFTKGGKWLVWKFEVPFYSFSIILLQAQTNYFTN